VNEEGGVNAVRRSAGHALAIRVAAFAGLAALAAGHWARLVTDPPVGHVALAAAVLIAGATLLALLATSDLGRSPAWALAALGAVVATAAGLVAIGVPARLLEPGAWDQLSHELGRGFAGLDRNVEYPYSGGNEWSRVVILAGLPLALGLAAALAFWPSRRIAPRTAALAILVATYGIGATVVAPGETLLWGLVLLFLVSAWLWLPGLGRADAISAGVLIAVAGAVAVAAAARLDAEGPWVDYRDWELASGGSGISFDWDHSYGPLDWPREGTTLFGVRSDEPQYWKASILDYFDGTRWLRPELSAGERLEVPTQIEGGSSVVEADSLNPEWVKAVGVTFGPMRSDLLIAPGSVLEVNGFEGVLSRPDGTTVSDDEPIEDGDTYSVVAYVPDPTAEQLRRAPSRYPAVLARYTEIGLPVSGDVDMVDVPLRGAARVGDPAAQRRILDSPYADMYRLAHRLTEGEPTAYQAVTAIAGHLRSGRYAYTEVPSERPYPLTAFLSKDKTGYCQHFSGAMALMLRMVGIPSRVASGFSAGSRDEDNENRYLVTDLDAHSWVEVYFTGIGWVSFDPTPSAAPAASQLGEGEFADLAGGSRAGREQPRPAHSRAADTAAGPSSSGGSGLWMILPAGVGLLGLAVAVPAAVRARRYRSLSASAAAEAQLRELGPVLGRLGSPVLPGETLLALENRLRMSLRPVTARYVAKLRAGRFQLGDPGAPTLAERRALRRELSSKRGLRGRLRGIFAIPPGGPRR
jgi:transglutaminase-like putative cysteine protease